MTGFTTCAFLSRNRVSPKEAFEGLELCERKLSCTVLRGLDGSNPVRLLGCLVPTGWPQAVAHLRLPQNVACGFAALRSSEVASQFQQHRAHGGQRKAVEGSSKQFERITNGSRLSDQRLRAAQTRKRSL